MAESELEAPKSESLPLEKALKDYRPGDEIRGNKIKHIYHATSRFLVYSNGFGHVAYSIRFGSPQLAAIIAEFNRWVLATETQLRGAYRSDSTHILAGCMASALHSIGDDNPGLEHFEPIRLFLQERGPIEYMYAQNTQYSVYLNKTGIVTYEVPAGLSADQLPLIAEFHRLQHIARCTLEGSDAEQVNAILGTDLVSVLRSANAAEASNFFLSSREFITNRSEAILRSRYIKSSVLSAIVLAAILLPVIYVLRKNTMNGWEVALGSLGGLIGATLSIIQRGGSLTINPFVPITQVVFQGTVRVLLGVVFGALLIVASKANIALGIIENNLWSLMIFSVVAGFSERFVPDILDRIAIESNHMEPKN